MASRDLYSNLGVVAAIEPQVATVDVTGDWIDTRGFGSVMLAVQAGASGDTLSGSVKVELEVEHSDDGSSGSDAADTDLHRYVDGTNPGCFAVIDDAAEDDAVYLTGYKGSKRYVRVVANLTGTHSNGIEIAGVAILGHPELMPVNATT